MKNYDVVIVGGGISGEMMASRLNMVHPSLSCVIVDSPSEQNHPFHLHRTISEIESLRAIKSVVLRNNIYSESGFSDKPNALEACDYSRKTLGRIQITNCNRLEDSTIFPISKEELIKRMSEVSFNTQRVLGKISHISVESKVVQIKDSSEEISYKYLISTIPLPIFLGIANIFCSIDFSYTPFYTAKHSFGYDTGVYHIIYNAHKKCNITRTTLLGDCVFVESNSNSLTDWDKSYFKSLYGVNVIEKELNTIFPGRFNLIPQDKRKSLLHWITQKHDIMCLGRFGAWTFKVANDVWDDTKFLCEIIFQKEMALAWSIDHSKMQEELWQKKKA